MTDALDASQLPPVVPAMAESRFSVEGLDCYEEVGLLERRLGVLAGVDTVAVDLLSRRLRVTYDPARLSVGDITTTVADAGMRARPESGPADRPPGRGGLWPLGLAGVAFGSGAASAALGATPVVTRTLLAVAIVAAGALTVRRAVAAVRARRLDIHVLMMVAVLGALLIGEWVEAAAVLVLFALAQELESRSLDRARRAIGRLIELAPDRVLVRRPEGEREVAIDTVRPGDLAIVRPGTKVPVDGRVVEGRSHVDQAALTGESLPVTRVRGDQVFAGTMNGEGALEVEVTRAPEDTTLAQVARLVERAQASRAPSQTFVERFARRYTPAVIALAGALAVVPPLTGFGTLEAWGYRALVLLVIACPCALVIATPVSFVSALAAAARRGVLVKDGAHLERVSQVRCVAFDKTGTLTTGRLRVVSVSPVGATPASVVLEVAASLEARSEHPIAKAICRHAERAGIAWQPATDCRELSGRGMEGRLASSPVLVGSPRLLAERGLASPDVDALVSAAAERGQTPVLIAKDGAAIGVIAVADSVREGGQATVEALRGLGVAHIVLLTGDSEAAGRAIARELNLDSYLADLLPQDKLDAIAEVRGRHGTVIMVGDGVNDAPALAAADVGVAMAVAGTDVALETADVTLMGDELDRLPYLLRLSRATLHVVKSNVAVALGLKLVFLALAVAGAATLWMAVAADMGASLLVIGNGLRLLRTE